ncbi:glutamyl-tRNA(Gln) amidotransferase subunit E [Candidatus Woesearchaeota archaeon RBG_13_36_6]|nr:MAG: glutamyl-tRNA(Gln) amidotransferase subunit E [Candidatus Woesearchaeota archaeon RBG_13_36_6]
MNELNYEKLGFKCGIEIHQQLDTSKLFCGCPGIIIDEKPDFEVKRYLRAAAGETGEIDIAAKHEMEKGKYFLYYCYDKNTCLVELDEEPPHLINKEALKIALIITKLLNAKIVDEIQVMRKTVVDGSNTAGFQRTALIARDGYIETSKGIVKIPIICLEEDAAKIVKRTEDHDIYNLSRLGIPLVEIGTDASIKDPEHAKEVASRLGMILRSTKVKRGLGTIRQDVNLSIKEGARIEIKGFQDIKSMPKIIENEIIRQLDLIKKGIAVNREVRKAEPDFTTSFLRPLPGAARMYPETDVLPIKPDLGEIKAPKLLTDKIEELKQIGLSEELATTIVKKKELFLFEEFVKKYKKIEPKFIATTLINTPKEIKKRYNIESKIEEQKLNQIFNELNKGKISKEAIFEILLELSQGKKLNLEKYELMSDEELKLELERIAEQNKGLPLNAVIGKAMQKLRGKADGKKIAEILKENMN